MENDIIKFLDLKDDDLNIINIEIIDGCKYIHIQKQLKPIFCPICSQRMHSKGVYVRNVNYPILQNGYQLILAVHQRKWKCTNPVCNHMLNDEFTFVQKYKQSTNLTPYMILYDLKDLNKTAVDAARKYFVSDTYVHYTVLMYLDLPRLPLPEIISIDEVHMKYDKYNLYSLVIMDFITGDIIDILPNRLQETTAPYFLSIPLEERNNVKYLICDMYNPYINYTKSYFRQAEAIVDSFHVIQWLIQKINAYINDVKKAYQKRDDEKLKEENEKNNTDYQTAAVSTEVYLLNNYRWILLKNKDNIEYSTFRKYNRKLKRYVDTYDLEKEFLDLDKNFRLIRKEKERYIEFNSSPIRDEQIVTCKLEKFIDDYAKSEIELFRDFSDLLKKYKKEIINSFIEIPDESPKHKETTNKLRRLSNGSIEGFNRFPKDYKRNSRGVKNFEYTRNRILWSFRDNAHVLGIPKKKAEIYNHTDKERGKYKKNKK